MLTDKKLTPKRLWTKLRNATLASNVFLKGQSKSLPNCPFLPWHCWTDEERGSAVNKYDIKQGLLMTRQEAKCLAHYAYEVPGLPLQGRRCWWLDLPRRHRSQASKQIEFVPTSRGTEAAVVSMPVGGLHVSKEICVRPCRRQDAVAGLALGLLVHLLQSRGVFTLGFFLPLLRLRHLFKRVTPLQTLRQKNAHQLQLQRPCWRGTGSARKLAWPPGEDNNSCIATVMN